MILGKFDGEYFEAYRGGKYGSGSILPIKESNGVAIFCEEISRVEEGQIIKILPLPFELNDIEKNYQWINFQDTFLNKRVK